ncbi:hypothetical protein BOX15_Mlig028683g2 [Macrostomum lignano]|uniref:Uncharacterized protein n=1 Tax=Macrostomum lignano TaxID=282301 RepID=A0A267DHD2_9PLAT|nr:hypothetical protein BOX15_Mlig028683g2 [Macrostomum lignano]
MLKIRAAFVVLLLTACVLAGNSVSGSEVSNNRICRLIEAMARVADCDSVPAGIDNVYLGKALEKRRDRFRG